MPDKTFKVGNEIYDIPEKDVSAFMKDFSDAIEVQSFIVDKDTFDIPINDVQEFMKDYPNAKPLKKKRFSDRIRGILGARIYINISAEST